MSSSIILMPSLHFVVTMKSFISWGTVSFSFSDLYMAALRFTSSAEKSLSSLSSAYITPISCSDMPFMVFAKYTIRRPARMELTSIFLALFPFIRQTSLGTTCSHFSK